MPALPRKAPNERLRRLVHFLLNDDDYIALLEISSPQDVSAFVRDLVKAKIAEHRSAPQNDG